LHNAECRISAANKDAENCKRNPNNTIAHPAFIVLSRGKTVAPKLVVCLYSKQIDPPKPNYQSFQNLLLGILFGLKIKVNTIVFLKDAR
jgi:hypothetical protein